MKKGTSKAARVTSTHLKNVLIAYRPHKPEAFKLAEDVAGWLRHAGIKVWTRTGQKTLKGSKSLTRPQELDRIELVIVVGGDGTYLKSVQLLAGRPVPVLGANLGSLGFLTDTRIEELYHALDLALRGKLKRHERILLEVEVNHKRSKRGRALTTPGQAYLALNDIVIERGPIGQLINLGVYSREKLVTELKADGLIVATPTGSTAYNLAAGGPILHPDLEAIVVTPVCAHSLTNRPITVPASVDLNIRITEAHQKAAFVIDGQRRVDVAVDDDILIRVSDKKHLALQMPDHSYFDLLREKLKFGHRD